MSTTTRGRTTSRSARPCSRRPLKISGLADRVRDGSTKEQVIEELPDQLTDEAGVLIQLASELEDLRAQTNA